MSVPPIRRITLNQLGENPPPFLDALLDQLNSVLDFYFRAFEGGVQSSGITRELAVKTSDQYTSGEFDVMEFDSGVRTRVQAVNVLQVIDRGDEGAVLSGPYFVDWRANGGSIAIRWISGLDASKDYFVRVHVW